MTLQRGAGPRQMRVLVRKFYQVLDDAAAFGAVVADENFGGAQMQFFDGRQPRQAERFARDDNGQCQRGGGRKAETEKAESLATREQILDQLRDAETETKQHQSADGAPEHAAPGKAAPRGEQRRLDKDRQQRGIAFRRDADRAARRAAGFIRIHHDHTGIVELEGLGLAGALAHCSLSPIRNWRARSRRM